MAASKSDPATWQARRGFTPPDAHPLSHAVARWRVRAGGRPAGQAALARPEGANQREMATDGEASRPRDAKMQLANVRSAPNPALARPPPTR